MATNTTLLLVLVLLWWCCCCCCCCCTFGGGTYYYRKREPGAGEEQDAEKKEQVTQTQAAKDTAAARAQIGAFPITNIGEGKWIKNQAFSDMCLEVPYGDTNNGVKLGGWGCSAYAHQAWSMDAEQRLRNSATGKCFGPAGGSAAHKTSVVQWDCADVDHMKWGLDDQGRMRPKHAPSMCLALEKAGEREVLSLNECDGSARQKWAATAPPPPNHKLLKSRLRSNLCLSVPSKDTNNGTELTTWDCANSPIDWPNYGFGMDAENRLVNKESGKCITVAGAGTHDGAAIVQQDCGRGPHFRWTHDDAGRLRPAHAPKMCMNISGGDPRNGGKIILYECTTDGATNELWDFV